MIARALPAERTPKKMGTRAGRGASVRRRANARRLRYRNAARTVSAVMAATAAIMLYLGLLANITRLHYDIARAERARSNLDVQTARLDERISQLKSDDRLIALAARLGMRDPSAYAVVQLPPASPAAQRDPAYALLGAVTGLNR